MNLQALSDRRFRRYFAANMIALHGVWLQRVVLGWLAWSLTGQAGFVGLIAFLSFAPTLISGPLFGVAADRVDLRRAALVTQGALGLCTAALLIAQAAGVLGTMLLAVIAGAIGIATSAHHPIRMTLGPQLVGREALGSVVALTSLGFNLARLVGPALGGWLIAAQGVTAALAVNLACYLPFLTVLALLRLPPRAGSAEAAAGVFASLRAGVGYAARDGLIRRALLLTGVYALVGRGLLEILPVLADGAFGRGPVGLGSLTAAAGAGALTASLTIAFGPGQRPGRLPVSSLLGALAGLGLVIALGRTSSWPLAVALVAGLGFCSTLVGVTAQSAVQLVLPDAYRGRVMSLWTMVGIGAAALGAIGLGFGADHAGLGTTLTIAGASAFAAVLAQLLWRRRRVALATAAPPHDLVPESFPPAAGPQPEPAMAPQHVLPSRADILAALERIAMPGTGASIVKADIVRALSVEPAPNGAAVRFVLEVDPAQGAALEPVRAEAEAAVAAMPGVASVAALLTAHGPAPKAPPAPDLKIGRHPTPQAGPAAVAGVERIIAVGSGKGGVGKSTVAANLAVALAQEGKRVGLLDADIYGPSQPRMMGVNERPKSPDGKTIIPLQAHGVTVMSIGLMLKEGEAVVWRGPMLMGALQQMMNQVAWGTLDVLIVDLPPGTGDVQLTLSQKYQLTGAIIVSTPQDVALIDARKALDMFAKTRVAVLGIVENMSAYICPNCGHEAHIFGHGGARAEAQAMGVPFLGEIPLDIAIRLSGDGGTPVAAASPDSPEAAAFRSLARRLIGGGIV